MELAKKSARDWFFILAMIFLQFAAFYMMVNGGIPEQNRTLIVALMMLMFVAAMRIEVKYVPYVGVIPSAIFIYALMAPEWPVVPDALKMYALFSLAFVIPSFFIYYKRRGQTLWKSPVYGLSMILYSMKIAFPLYLTFFILKSFEHPYFLYAFALLSLISWLFWVAAGI